MSNAGERMTVAARDAQPGDVWTDNSGQAWLIDHVGTEDEIGVTIRLRSGRSSLPMPEVFNGDEMLTVLRTGVR